MAAAVEAEDKHELLQQVGLVQFMQHKCSYIHSFLGSDMLAGQDSVAGGQLWRFEAFMGDVELLWPPCALAMQTIMFLTKFVSRDRGRCPRTPARGLPALGPWEFFVEGVAPGKYIQKARKGITAVGSCLQLQGGGLTRGAGGTLG
eukprot:351489-Chlamydomonas_euryale.AAC.2